MTLHAPALKWHQMPPVLRRAFIKDGYRLPDRTWRYYWRSMFWIHNETVNVWTHFLPALWFLARLCLTDSRVVFDSRFWPAFVLYFVTILLLFGSSVAHLFHSRSKFDHFLWFMIDLLGISLYILGIGVQRYYSNPMPRLWGLESLYCPLLVLLCIGHFLYNSYLFVCHTFWKRRALIRMISCLAMTAYLYVPLIPRYLAEKADSGLELHTKALAWFFLSGVFMGCHIPERIWPGAFDLLGYGHQIFHVCILMVNYYLIEGARWDCEHNMQMSYSLLSLAGPVAAVTFCDSFITAVLLLRQN